MILDDVLLWFERSIHACGSCPRCEIWVDFTIEMASISDNLNKLLCSGPRRSKAALKALHLHTQLLPDNEISFSGLGRCMGLGTRFDGWFLSKEHLELVVSVDNELLRHKMTGGTGSMEHSTWRQVTSIPQVNKVATRINYNLVKWTGTQTMEKIAFRMIQVPMKLLYERFATETAEVHPGTAGHRGDF